jgi:hypothetical protein
MSSRPTKLRKVLNIGLMIAVGGFYSLITSSALAQTRGRLAGELSLTGSVTINGASAIAGATIFSDSVIRTSRNSAAIVSLGSLGRLQLGPESEMTLRFTEATLGGNLSAGRAVVNAPIGVAITVVTASGVATSTGRKASALTVDVTCGDTLVAAIRGDANVAAEGRVENVTAGKEVTVGSQATSRCTRTTEASFPLSLTAGTIAALLLGGIGAGVAGAIALTQADNLSPSSVIVSGFRP